MTQTIILPIKGKWIDNGWKSNMFHVGHIIPYKGLLFNSVESFYQANKVDPRSPGWAKTLMQLAKATPSKAKQLGKSVPLRKDWNSIKDQVMITGLRYKFQPGYDWTTQLLTTKEEEIEVYSNWGDNYWEISCTLITPRENEGVFRVDGGSNVLGKLLTEVRNSLRANLSRE